MLASPRRAPEGPKRDPVARLARLEAPPARRVPRALKLALAAVGLVMATLVTAPPLVRHLAIAKAREAGVVLTVDRVSVGLGGVALRGVTAETRALPGSSASLREVRLVGLRGRDVRVTGVDVRLVGTVSDVRRSLSELVADSRSRGAKGDARHVTVAGARLTWKGLAGEGSRLEAGGVGVDLASDAGADLVRANVDVFASSQRGANSSPHSCPQPAPLRSS